MHRRCSCGAAGLAPWARSLCFSSTRQRCVCHSSFLSDFPFPHFVLSVTCLMHAQDPVIVPRFVQIKLASRRRSPQAAEEPRIPTCVVLSLEKLILNPSLQVYPTTVRSLGMGVVNSFSRIGGLLSPFVAVALVQVCALPQYPQSCLRGCRPLLCQSRPCCAKDMLHNSSETKCHHANGSARQAPSPSVRSGMHTASPERCTVSSPYGSAGRSPTHSRGAVCDVLSWRHGRDAGATHRNQGPRPAGGLLTSPLELPRESRTCSHLQMLAAAMSALILPARNLRVHTMPFFMGGHLMTVGLTAMPNQRRYMDCMP